MIFERALLSDRHAAGTQYEAADGAFEFTVFGLRIFFGHRHFQFHAASARQIQPARNDKPPIDLIARSQRTPEIASTYRLPLKITMPTANRLPLHFRDADCGANISSTPTASSASAW